MLKLLTAKLGKLTEKKKDLTKCFTEQATDTNFPVKGFELFCV